MTCSVPGCDRRGIAKNLCANHYALMKRNGSPTTRRIAPAGSGWIRNDGYRAYHIKGNECLEHIMVAEKMNGGPLPKGAIVHHINGDRLDNRPENLVICPNRGAHMTLHKMQRALESCGRTDLVRCYMCKQYDHPENLKVHISAYHPQCKRDRENARYHQKHQARGEANYGDNTISV